MAISLERMKELEEQVKLIPVLQVRFFILTRLRRIFSAIHEQPTEEGIIRALPSNFQTMNLSSSNFR
jgi:hypothetical protein